MDVRQPPAAVPVFFVGILGGRIGCQLLDLPPGQEQRLSPPALIFLLGVSVGIATTIALHPQNTPNVALVFWRFF